MVGDEVSEPGCDPDITCKDVLTVVSDVCQDATDSVADDVNTDAASLKVHLDISELGTVPRIRIYLEKRRKYLPWVLLVFVGSLLTLRTVRPGRRFLWEPGNQVPTKCLSSSEIFGRIHALSRINS